MTTSPPILKQRDEQPYVAIPISVALKDWDQALALVPELFGWMGQKDITPAGHLFYRYWTIGDLDAAFELEVGIPVESVAVGDGRVIAGSIPAGTYANIVHTGHPDGVLEALPALEAWAEREGIDLDKRQVDDTKVWGGRFEFYLTDPAVEPDLEKWSIEIAFLLKNADAEAREPHPRRADQAVIKS